MILSEAEPAAAVSFALKLPRPYRAQEVLAFHARDPGAVSAPTVPCLIRKGFMSDRVPIVLEIHLRNGGAACYAFADRPIAHKVTEMLRNAARKTLGLHLDPIAFQAVARNDPLLGPLVSKGLGLRIPQTPTAFEALMWAIIGQQINLRFAITLRRSFIEIAGTQHSCGLWCHPDAAAVARLNPSELCRRKFSRAKAETLVRVAQLIGRGAIPFAEGSDGPGDDTEPALLAVKGIGPWTVNYTLLRGFGLADCSLHGDVAVRTALQRLTGASARPKQGEAQAWLECFKPHRSWVAAHLWASLHVTA